jgi:putative glutathione S-transferase
MIFRALKGLEEHIGVSVVHPDMLGDGWTFATDFDGATGDTLFGRPSCGRSTSARSRRDDPRDGAVLWDTQPAVSCRTKAPRSSGCSTPPSTGSPATRSISTPRTCARIDEINARVYSDINNGVYKSGFATSQEAYDKAVHALFDALDWVEGILAENRYLDRGPRDRGRLAAVHDAGALRFRSITCISSATAGG